jgi:sterol 3beta-glucosyltransferase
MNILLLTAGTRGDVEPFAHLARHLRAAGHDVTLALPDNSGADIAGLATESLGVDFAAVVAGQGVSAWRAARTLRTTVRPLMRTLLTAAARAVAAHRPDVVVHHPKALSAPVAAASLGIPHLSAEMVPASTPTRAFPAPGVVHRDLGGLNRRTWIAGAAARRMFAAELAAAVGPGRNGSAPGGRGVLLAVSPNLLPRPADWPATVRMTGPWQGPATAARPVAEVADFVAGGGHVYAGFGSMAAGDPVARARAVVLGARAAGLRVLLARGWGGLSLPADLAGDDVLVVDAVPHELVLPGAAVAVHHGGAGTVHAAARAGVPQLVVPFMGDQPFWAGVVDRAGLGRRAQRRLRPATVAAALAGTAACGPAARAVAADARRERRRHGRPGDRGDGQRFLNRRTAAYASPAPSTHGAATMIGSSRWWPLSARLPVKREDSPWWLNSLSTPVSAIRLSGRRLTNERSVLSSASTRSEASRISQCAARPSLYLAYANLRITPESPLGGQDVPNTGVSIACSIDRSRGHFSGCRSGNSQCAPLKVGSNCSRGTDGRSLGSRSTPHPGMRARSSSLDSASFGLSGV